ncbi:hypothetical protein [Brucella anthropi]|uniref:hypothetical protein n=1 Tax=Brucella anthropi TaxID=529 RepID=UPI00235FC129|nr:hypothetical protein [Brucella anthropi]
MINYRHYILSSLLLLLAMQASSANACNRQLLSVEKWSIQPAGLQPKKLSIALKSGARKAAIPSNASVIFEDTAGDMLFSSYLDKRLIFTPGQTQTVEIGLLEDDALEHMRKEDVRAYVCVRQIEYSDGRKESFDLP